MTTALHECDFVQTVQGPQIPTPPQVYGPETTRRSHVASALDVLCLGHMTVRDPGNHTACHVGPHNISKMFGPVRAPYFHTRTIFLLFYVSRRPVDRLAGAAGPFL